MAQRVPVPQGRLCRRNIMTQALGLPRRRDQVYYPETEEQKVGETDFHMAALIFLRQALQDYFAPEPLVYVASDLFWYYVEGDASQNVCPDVMVVKGVDKHFRRVFKSWEEGDARPRVTFEIVSGRTARNDRGPKRRQYQRLRVPEYFLFDPEGRYLRPVLQGYRLRGPRYARLKPAADGSLLSEELGLRLLAEGSMLRLLEARTGLPIWTRDERAAHAARRAEEEKRRAEEEKRRAEALAAENERLRAALAQAEAAPKPPRRNGKKKA
jgi:Uma2 family endonuclease